MIAIFKPARILLLGLFFAVAFVGCKAENPAFDPDPLDENSNGTSGNTTTCSGGSAPVTQEFSSLADPSQLDLLVVVSNAPGTEALQTRLADAMPALVQQLTSAGVDFHLGIITGDTTSEASAGVIRSGGAGQRPNCDNSPRIITSADGELSAAYAACNVLQGQNGSPYQRFFSAAELALSIRATDPDELTGNAAFLRPQARLMLLFVTDRDDCSSVGTIDTDNTPNPQSACEWSSINLSNVSDFAQFFVGLKKELNATSVAILGGADDDIDVDRPDRVSSVCSDASGNEVFPSTRLLSLADQLTPNTGFESACASSFLGSMVRLSALASGQNSAVLCLDNGADGQLRSVTRVTDDSETPIPPGEQGYLYLGPTDDCATGAVQINSDQLQGDANRNVKVTYCSQ